MSSYECILLFGSVQGEWDLGDAGGIADSSVVSYILVYNCAGFGLGEPLGFNRGATGLRCDQRLPAFCLR